MTRTLRETKNKILADMPPEERADALVGETPRGGYIILGHYRVFEIYESGDRRVWVSVKSTPAQWEDFDL